MCMAVQYKPKESAAVAVDLLSLRIRNRIVHLKIANYT
jgi:hypothetical protein